MHTSFFDNAANRGPVIWFSPGWIVQTCGHRLIIDDHIYHHRTNTTDIVHFVGVLTKQATRGSNKIRYGIMDSSSINGSKIPRHKRPWGYLDNGFFSFFHNSIFAFPFHHNRAYYYPHVCLGHDVFSFPSITEGGYWRLPSRGQGLTNAAGAGKIYIWVTVHVMQ